ncbi:MAG: nucleotidyltransferase domain-containing protein [Actinobacteria bacterium]|nr:nucleotidyltransferase domain-containing protein [Actinomycetota bacterium]MCL5444606.1 nucleotidyltransferase domain-containing protein [Actinomycetota bacterium]
MDDKLATLNPNDEFDYDDLASICERYGIAELSLFGSSAKGTARPDSDVDLLYVRAPGSHLGWEIEDLAAELSLLSGRTVDLVSKQYLHHVVRDEVLSTAKVPYAA